MSLKRIITSLALISALGVGVAACEVPEDPSTSAPSAKVVKKANAKAAKADQPASDTSSDETSAQENAREKAESHLDTSAFSKSGLIDQLKFEGFSKADATYAVNAITVNWYKQAKLKAESYLDTSSFSAAGLLEQLKFEGFTDAEASYGVSKAY
jgi:hypothetical protein